MAQGSNGPQLKSFVPSITDNLYPTSPGSNNLNPSLEPSGTANNNGAPLVIRNYKLILDAASPFPSSIDSTGHAPLLIEMSVPTSWQVDQVNVNMDCVSKNPSHPRFSRTSVLKSTSRNATVFSGQLKLLESEPPGPKQCVLSFAFVKSGQTVRSVDVDTHLHDPFGIVTDAATNAALRGVRVTLYVFQNGQWIIWPAQIYNDQINPQSTDEQGTFTFLTPSGEYYLTGSKAGYDNYKSQILSVSTEAIEQNFSLKQIKTQVISPSSSLKIILTIIFIIGGAVILLYFRENLIGRKR